MVLEKVERLVLNESEGEDMTSEDVYLMSECIAKNIDSDIVERVKLVLIHVFRKEFSKFESILLEIKQKEI